MVYLSEFSQELFIPIDTNQEKVGTVISFYIKFKEESPKVGWKMFFSECSHVG